MYQIKTDGEMVWLEAEAFAQADRIMHAFSTRHGGKSSFPYTDLNLGLHTGDDIAVVRDNRKCFMSRFGVIADEVVSLHFMHSNIVLQVGDQDGGKGFLSADTALGDADGMITNVPRRALFVTYADCVPVLFYDPVQQAIGACHAGWRGTVAGICMETVKAMQNAYGSKPEDLIVAVGPAIDPNNFEVGEEVSEAVSAHSKRPEYLLKTRKNGKYLFNIWQANVDQLVTAGVLKEHITVLDVSTFARDDLFFSHRRRLGDDVGRQAAFIMLK